MPETVRELKPRWARDLMAVAGLVRIRKYDNLLEALDFVTRGDIERAGDALAMLPGPLHGLDTLPRHAILDLIHRALEGV